ncbi:uncharacterized protein BX663DRAFT_536766 [Cokeromyces recurvatus]|uniref:uncharacterized protein n=1 Tax=Cokeromyces recurvatus TaxID=90255 RepID=UPI00221EB9C7|nr:uncharacterized protein BX663DRAFT_536766 [Cokeromyces recurvatus]KAI7902122.1 hypothetical protein BX663DRAFT_536766 [Cokeromyces recurvatus]
MMVGLELFELLEKLEKGAGGFGPLVVVDETVNQDIYIDILARHFHPWFIKLNNDYDREFIFQEDSAWCHTSGYATWWKETHQVRGFHYWPPQNIHHSEDLKKVLKEEWKMISHDLAEILVGSMHDRCKAVITAKGGPTKD